MMATQGVDPYAKPGAECHPRFENRAFQFGNGRGLLGTSFGPHHVGATSVPPDVKVSGGVADIFKSGLRKLFGQQCCFVRTFQINLAVTGKDFIDESEIAGNQLRDASISGGRENDAPPEKFFGAKQVENWLAIRETGRVEIDPAGELALEDSSPGSQPKRNQESCEWAGFQEDQNAFPKHISTDQSAVEIHAQHRQHDLGGLSSGGGPHEVIVAF